MSIASTTANARWVEVTPELAQAILGEHAPNRTIRQLDVARYAADMAADKWTNTGEAIKFDEQGCLLDGQHRLSAVVKADMTVPLLFVYDVPRAAQDVMDSGRKRSLADQLAMRGQTNCNALAAGIKAAHDIEVYGKPRATRNKSVATLLEWFETHQDIADSYAPVRKALDVPVKYPSGIAIALHYSMAKLAKEEADLFWRVLGFGDHTPGADAVLVLREKMLTVAAETQKGHVLDSNRRAAYTITAWNAWITGRDIKIFRFRPHLGDTFPTLLDPKGI